MILVYAKKKTSNLPNFERGDAAKFVEKAVNWVNNTGKILSKRTELRTNLSTTPARWVRVE